MGIKSIILNSSQQLYFVFWNPAHKKGLILDGLNPNITFLDRSQISNLTWFAEDYGWLITTGHASDLPLKFARNAALGGPNQKVFAMIPDTVIMQKFLDSHSCRQEKHIVLPVPSQSIPVKKHCVVKNAAEPKVLSKSLQALLDLKENPPVTPAKIQDYLKKHVDTGQALRYGNLKPAALKKANSLLAAYFIICFNKRADPTTFYVRHYLDEAIL